LAAETPLASGAVQLKHKCVVEGGVKAYYILKALAKDGFKIRPENIKLDRRRGKRK
jgi:hypothetical protein